jgi:hypothetical protein
MQPTLRSYGAVSKACLRPETAFGWARMVLLQHVRVGYLKVTPLTGTRRQLVQTNGTVLLLCGDAYIA